MVILNYPAIVGAALASFFLGWLWYSPLLFGKLHMKQAKMKDCDMKHVNMPLLMLESFLTTLIMSYVLAHFVDYAGASDWKGGVVAGFWIWLGFVGAISYGRVIWGKDSKGEFALGSGFHLVELMMMGAILASF